MSSFNSQHYSVPISVTPILPSLLLSFPFFLAPSPHLFFPLGLTWTNTHQHTHIYFIPPSSSLYFYPLPPFLQGLAFVTSLPELFFLFFVGYRHLRSTATPFWKIQFSLLWVSCNLDRFQQGRPWSHPVTMERIHPQPSRVSCFAL